MAENRVHAFARGDNFTYFTLIDSDNLYLFIEFNTEKRDIEIRNVKLGQMTVMTLMKHEYTSPEIFDQNPATKRIVEETKYYKYRIWEAIFEYEKMK